MARAKKTPEQEPTCERLLAEAERRIKKLESRVAEQKETIRGLRAQIRQDDNNVEHVLELKLEISDLKSEIKELTRANHEFSARYESIRGGVLKSRLKARGASMSGPETNAPELSPPAIATA